LEGSSILLNLYSLVIPVHWGIYKITFHVKSSAFSRQPGEQLYVLRTAWPFRSDTLCSCAITATAGQNISCKNHSCWCMLLCQTSIYRRLLYVTSGLALFSKFQTQSMKWAKALFHISFAVDKPCFHRRSAWFFQTNRGRWSQDILTSMAAQILLLLMIFIICTLHSKQITLFCRNYSTVVGWNAYWMENDLLLWYPDLGICGWLLIRRQSRVSEREMRNGRTDERVQSSSCRLKILLSAAFKCSRDHISAHTKVFRTESAITIYGMDTMSTVLVEAGKKHTSRARKFEELKFQKC
jgi:hypothetical protein